MAALHKIQGQLTKFQDVHYERYKKGHAWCNKEEAKNKNKVGNVIN